MLMRSSLTPLGVACLALAAAGGVRGADLAVYPATVALHGPTARAQVLVSATRDGRPLDRTREAAYRSEDPRVVEVDRQGRLRPRGDGEARIRVEHDGDTAECVVRVSGLAPGASPPPTFERDIQPILARAGCNSGPCHGKASGQNGFKLSLLGFDSTFDFHALTRDAQGRRVLPADPDRSLVLAKGAARLPHGGGPKLDPGGDLYATLRAWIVAGMPRDPGGTPPLKALALRPAGRTMTPGEAQQLAVVATFADGSTRDVTHLAAYQSSESVLVAVDADGLVRAGRLPGEVAITARYEGAFASCDVSIPLAGEVAASAYAALDTGNPIDRLVGEKLRKLGLAPSPPAGDATFLRRAYLDAIGTLPTPEETRAFLGDGSPDKRPRLVDALLARPEYADHWANKWADLLRPNPYRVGIKAVLNLDSWIRDAFRENRPYDRFVREILTARGSTFRDGPAVIFRDRREPEELATMMSQLFLGIRLECAKCHHHPFEVWSQSDFYGFAAYFARVGRKGTGLSPPISGSEEVMFTAPKGEVRHPLTNEVLPPRPLFGPAPEVAPDADPRAALAAWVTSPDNPYFARVIVNRVWADLMGRGIVEPVDDLRATNPPANAALLDALAGSFREDAYDLKKLIRRIMTSAVYGLSSEPGDRNAVDGRNYSRRYRQRLRAEVLLDAVGDITGVPDRFEAAPPRTRAAALWTVRGDSLFLDSFGRPDPNQDPPCERTPDTSVVQALHLMNAPELHAKVTGDDGRAAALAKGDATPGAIVEELYLRVYCRPPDDEERAVALALFGDAPAPADRRRAVEDLLWALLNTPEFVFKD
jgi:hypothetical protein